MRSGAWSPRPTLVPRTSESASSAWPTATSTDPKASGALGYSTEGRHAGTTLTDAATKLWPTPNAGQANYDEDPETFRTRQAQLREKHGNNGAGDPLGILAQEMWQTPTAARRARRGGERSDEPKLTGQAEARRYPDHKLRLPGETDNQYWKRMNAHDAQWGTPQAHERSHRSREVDHGVQIASQAETWNWPTPQTNPQAPNKGSNSTRPTVSLEATAGWATPTARDHKGPFLTHRQGGDDLARQTEVAWATPTASDGSKGSGEGTTRQGAPSLSTQTSQHGRRALRTGLDGDESSDSDPTLPPAFQGEEIPCPYRLNPRFVEWLMGLEIGWTEIP